MGCDVILALRWAYPDLACFVEPRLALTIRRHKSAQISFAQHGSDSRQHRPHVSATVAPKIDYRDVWLPGLQIHHDTVELFSKLLKIIRVLLPFRILADAHRRDDVGEDSSIAAVDVALHFPLRSKGRPVGVLLGGTPDLVYFGSDRFSLSCRQAIRKLQKTMMFLQLRESKGNRWV